MHASIEKSHDVRNMVNIDIPKEEKLELRCRNPVSADEDTDVNSITADVAGDRNNISLNIIIK